MLKMRIGRIVPMINFIFLLFTILIFHFFLIICLWFKILMLLIILWINRSWFYSQTLTNYCTGFILIFIIQIIMHFLIWLIIFLFFLLFLSFVFNLIMLWFFIIPITKNSVVIIITCTTFSLFYIWLSF